MARTHSSIALDSEEALRKAVGPDATAAFETDPNFTPSDPDTDAALGLNQDLRIAPSTSARAAHHA